jgi:hypothetical protein
MVLLRKKDATGAVSISSKDFNKGKRNPESLVVGSRVLM